MESLLRGRSDEVNEKKIAVLLATCLLVQPFYLFQRGRLKGSNKTERTQTQPKQQKPVQVKQQRKQRTFYRTVIND